MLRTVATRSKLTVAERKEKTAFDIDERKEEMRQMHCTSRALRRSGRGSFLSPSHTCIMALSRGTSRRGEILERGRASSEASSRARRVFFFKFFLCLSFVRLREESILIIRRGGRGWCCVIFCEVISKVSRMDADGTSYCLRGERWRCSDHIAVEILIFRRLECSGHQCSFGVFHREFSIAVQNNTWYRCIDYLLYELFRPTDDTSWYLQFRLKMSKLQIIVTYDVSIEFFQFGRL